MESLGSFVFIKTVNSGIRIKRIKFELTLVVFTGLNDCKKMDPCPVNGELWVLQMKGTVKVWGFSYLISVFVQQ